MDPWEPMPEAPGSPLPRSLAPDEIHVWRASLRQPAAEVSTFQSTLSAEERERASRFHFAKDRDAYIVGRGLLRRLLAHYIPLSPEALSFRYSPYGKPALAGTCEASRIEFNLSHSGELVLFAFTRERRIGIDIEWIRPDLSVQEAGEIAKQFFSPREVDALNALPESLHQAAFFHCWTQKEAYIKAQGEGLSMPLDRFDVSLHPAGPAVLLQTLDVPQEAAKWQLRTLPPAPGYAAAVAVEMGSRPTEFAFHWYFSEVEKSWEE